MKTSWFANLFVLGSLLVFPAAVHAQVPRAGDKAPLFIGQDQDGKTVKLKSLLGEKIVLNNCWA